MTATRDIVVGHWSWSFVVGHWSWSFVVSHRSWSLVACRRSLVAGTRFAFRACMIIKSLDDLQVYQQALEVGDAITAILERPCWVQDPRLRGQLSECADRIPANISEGFGQGTDRHCAHFQRIARG